MRLTVKSAGVIASCIALHSLAFAHPEAPHEALPTPQTWTSAWSWEPGIVIPIVLTAALYIIGVVRIRSRNSDTPAIRNWQIACFAAGWFTLVLALDSPLHKLGSVLFSAHMTQHELLMVIAAPLLALGQPLIAFLFALPERARRPVAAWFRRPGIARTWTILSGPLMVWAIHGSTLWAWHIPFLYEATLHSEFIHALQHTTFLGTALLFWWTLIRGSYGSYGYGVAFLYVFTTALHTSILGALLTFSGAIWYPIYADRTALWNLTPVEDQQLGGLVMWIPSGVIFIVVGIALFAAWVGESERRVRLGRVADVTAGGAHES